MAASQSGSKWKTGTSQSGAPDPAHASHSTGYDVFLSYRGPDEGKAFTRHLLAALERQGLNIFHDRKLPRGREIGSELLRGIEDSTVSIVIFSKNYAESRWCLDELVKINDCRKSSDQDILPVFFDVEPDEVRKQQGCYAKPFADHPAKFDENRISNWKAAMAEIGSLAGMHLQNDTNGDEAKFVDKIVEEVFRLLNLNDNYFD